MRHVPVHIRKLGRTDMHVTHVSLGGVGIGGMRTTDDDEVGIGILTRALDRGVNYVDTSPHYNESERRIGLAFRRMGGRPRGLHLSTKVGLHPARRGDYSGATARWCVENSLRVLGVDAVDAVLVHDPPSIHPVLADGGALEALEQLRSEGKLRWMGISPRDHAVLQTAVRTGRFDLILTFSDYNLVRQTALPVIAEAASAGVGVILGHVYLAGMLAGPDPAEIGNNRGVPERFRPDIPAARQWWVWARERGVSLRAVALQFAMRQPLIGTVLVGADTAGQVDEFMEAAAESLPTGIWDDVDARIASAARGR